MLNPSVNYVGTKARVKLNGDSLKQERNLVKSSSLLFCLWNR